MYAVASISADPQTADPHKLSPLLTLDKLSSLPPCLQVAAGMGIYGPRTVFCIALKDAPGCHEFLLQVRQARL